MRRNLLKLGRIIPLLVVVAVVAAVSISYYRSTRSSGTRPIPQVESLPEGATDLTEGFSVSHLEQGATTIEVTAKVRLGLKDRKSRFEQVKAKVYGKQKGKFDTITSLRCEVDHANGDVVFLENVVVTMDTPDGVSEAIPAIVRGERMTYSRSLDRVMSEAEVSFERGRISGSSQGLVYDSRSGLIILPSKVDLRVLPAQKGDHLLRIRAGSLKLHKQRGVMELYSDVSVEKGSSELTAAEMQAFFATPAWILRHIEAQGHVRSRSLDPNAMIEVLADRVRYDFGAGPDGLDKVIAQGKAVVHPLTDHSLRELSAREITVAFPPGSQSISWLRAVGEARVLFQTPNSSPTGSSAGAPESSQPTANGITRRILTSPQVNAHFRPGTGRLSEVEALGPSTLEEIPAGRGEERRSLSARSLRLYYREDSGRLKQFTADQEVKMEFSSASGTIRETTSHHLTAIFNRETSRLSKIRQTGDFNYREPGRKARSESATHWVHPSLIRLEGRPKVTDAKGETEADVIEFHRDRHLLKAQGEVRSNYFSLEAGRRNHSDIFASAEFMEYQIREGIGRYWKNAKLWQNDRSLYAEDIWLNRTEGKLVATGRVTSLFHRLGKEESSPGTMVRSEKMTYEEQSRKIVYEEKVATTTPQGKLESDRLQVFLQQEQGQISVYRALAEGNVKMAQSNRISFSQWAEYRGRERKVVLWGGPPRVVDYERGSTTGARLTIDIGGDSVAVEGNSQNRAVTTQTLSR